MLWQMITLTIATGVLMLSAVGVTSRRGSRRQPPITALRRILALIVRGAAGAADAPQEPYDQPSVSGGNRPGIQRCAKGAGNNNRTAISMTAR